MSNSKSATAIEAVIFDLDGVLVSTDEQHYLSWKRMADEEGIYFDRRLNQGCLGVSRIESLDVVLQNARRDYSREEKVELGKRKNRYYLELVEHLGPADVLPGARGILAGLRRRGIKTAVASGSRNAAHVLERIGLAGMFDAVVTGQDITRSKPDPEVFLKTAERLRTPPERCLVVEDAPAGVEAAAQAGMRALGISRGRALAGAERSVASLAEITPEEILAL